jgi:hypothetical protein
MEYRFFERGPQLARLIPRILEDFMLIREEYEAAYNYIAQTPIHDIERIPTFVLTGQPGIGALVK